MNNKINTALSLFFLIFTLAFPGEKKDFTLSEIISIGLKNNPLLLAKSQEVNAKKAALQASRRLLNPEIEFTIGQGTPLGSTTKRNTDGVSLSQPIENPFKRHYRVQMHKNEWRATEYLYNSSKLEVTYQIKKLFYTGLLLHDIEIFAQNNLNSLRETFQLIEKRVKLGETKELEAIKLHVETLKAQNELNKIKTELMLARENLNKFLGNMLPPDFSIIGKLDFIPLFINEESLLNKALLSHPLIKEKETELEFARNSLSFVKWQRLPDFTLSGFIHNELDGKNKGIGISLDIPLWNFKSKEIAEAQSLLQKQNEELKALRMELRTEIRSKLYTLRLTEQTLKLFHEGLLEQAEESLKISAVSYKQGEISLIEFLDSQRTYFSILKDYQDSLYSWKTDKASLEKAIGEELK